MEVHGIYFHFISVISVTIFIISMFSSYFHNVYANELHNEALNESKQNESDLVKLIKVDSTGNSAKDVHSVIEALNEPAEEQDYKFIPSIAPATASQFLDSLLISPSISEDIIVSSLSILNHPEAVYETKDDLNKKEHVDEKIRNAEHQNKLQQDIISDTKDSKPNLLGDDPTQESMGDDTTQESMDDDPTQESMGDNLNGQGNSKSDEQPQTKLETNSVKISIETDDAKNASTLLVNEEENKKFENKKETENYNESIKEQEVFENNVKTPDKKMLSFTEWKKKIDLVKEEEDIIDVSKLKSNKKKTKKEKRKIKKNYASIECGAKVVASNEESSNPASILKEDKDVYMLNPCTVNAWFVVELCERIQVDNIDIANFEMFSSTPELFDIYTSTRFPTREWQRVGSYVMKAEKKIQNFIIEEQVYAKFVKVVIKKYFGKEHYCPLSLLRVFGTTEVEQFEDDEDHQDSSSSQNEEQNKQDQNANSDSENIPTKNIFATAKDAMVDLVSGISKKLSGKDTSSETSSNVNDSIVTLLDLHENNDSLKTFDEIQSVVSVISNITLNTGYLFLLKYSSLQNRCPSHLFMRKRLKAIKNKNKKKRKRTVLSDSEFPPAPSPILATTTQQEIISSNIQNNSETAKVTLSAVEKNDLAKTITKSSDESTCSTLDTTVSNIRQILQPTHLPSFSIDQSVVVVTPPLNEESITDMKSEPSSQIDKYTIAKSIISTSTPYSFDKSEINEHVDVLEFQNKQLQSNVVAQKEEKTKSSQEPIIIDITESLSSSISSTDHNTTVLINSSFSDNSVIPESTTITTINVAKVEPSFSKVLSSITENQLTMSTDALDTSTSVVLKSESISASSSIQQPESKVQAESSVDQIDPSNTAAAESEATSMKETSTQEAMPTKETSTKEATSTKDHSTMPSTVTDTPPPDNSNKIPSSGLSGSKESIILKLNAKVKALQANLTMSMMYLEEMSERYRTAVEEVDKRHERKYKMLNSTLKIHQDLLKQQGELIVNLTEKISKLVEEITMLNETSRTRHEMLSDSYMFWFAVQIILVFIFMWACRPRQRHHELYTRSISEPVMRNPSKETLKRPIKATRSDSVISPSSAVIEVLPPKKKKRKRSRVGLLNVSIPDKSMSDCSSSNQETKVSKTAGLLFYAGKGLISGITGALYWGRSYKDKASRQAEALVDDIPSGMLQHHHGNGELRRTRSDELATIDEVDSIATRSVSAYTLHDKRMSKNKRSRK